MFRLAAKKAVPIDVAPEFELLVADASEALVIAVACLRRHTRQQDSAQQDRPAQGRAQ